MTTDAGKRLLELIAPAPSDAAEPAEEWVAEAHAFRNDVEGGILAIEAEAVAAERARIAEGVPLEEWWERGLASRNGSNKGMAEWVRAAVLAILEEKP